ncbi:MAG: hypothetical protein J7L15_07165 [Clostridiales bacterium]|nr:hypothetical protein [Clostridiales bacterium]
MTIMVDTNQSVDINQLEKLLPNTFIRIASSNSKNTIIIQTQSTTDEEKNKILNTLESVVSFDKETVTIGKVDPVVGDIFWRQAKIAIFLAFVFMASVVFLLFRSVAPSTAVILAAFSDIISTIAVMDILGIRLSLATLAALLMLIGYSIDTDILLTTRMLKRQGTFEEKLKSAMKTGLTMNATSLSALLSIFLFSQNFVLEQIALVLIIGLLIDLPNTWIQNAEILKIWLKRKGRYS